MSEKVSYDPIKAAILAAPGRVLSFNRSATMTPPFVMETNKYASAVTAVKNDKGGATLKGIRIFKSGTFKDSMGTEHTWEHIHLDQMALHFKMLRDGDIFPNVPIRVDHSWSAHSVVGYFLDVYRATDDENFLAADIEITEPDAYEKWERGTYRSRSLEVGMYETNDGAQFWPVIMGLAFVDIPAVEGLHRKDDPTRSSYAIRDMDEENDMKFTINGREVTAQEWHNAVVYAAWEQAANYAQACADWEAAANYAIAVESHNAQAEALGLQGVQVLHSNPASGGRTEFRVNGAAVSDPSQVQTHINTLETFRTETIASGRTNFVAALAKDGRIAATQMDSMTALVQTMTDTQFTAFKATYEGAPANPLLAVHGNQHNGGEQAGGQNDGNGGSTIADQIAGLEEIVANHKRAGMSPEQIEKTNSYQRLQALKAQA